MAHFRVDSFEHIFGEVLKHQSSLVYSLINFFSRVVHLKSLKAVLAVVFEVNDPEPLG